MLFLFWFYELIPITLNRGFRHLIVYGDTQLLMIVHHIVMNEGVSPLSAA